MRKKASISAEMKFKIALEVLRGVETQSAISKRFKVHPNQLSRWRKILLEKGATVFQLSENGAEPDSSKEIQTLYEQIGKLSVENDFLKKKTNY